jgi:quercetin dioxygenase-like cupin family protein
MPTETTLPPAEATDLPSLLAYAPHGIASRVLAKTGGGSATLFAFERGQALSEHTSPFEALVVVLEGALTLTIGGVPARAVAGTVTRMPADVPHALVADARTRMLLVLLRDPRDGGL